MKRARRAAFLPAGLPPAGLRCARFLGARFLSARGGNTAVEFATVAAPFFFLIFGIFELGMIFSASVALENSTSMLARTIRTGELQKSGSATASSFKTSICTNMGAFSVDCANKLHIDVRVYDNLAATNNQKAPITNGQWDATPPTFVLGNPGDIVLVRAYYEWPLIAPGFNGALQSLDGGKAVLAASATFRNEPYTQ